MRQKLIKYGLGFLGGLGGLYIVHDYNSDEKLIFRNMRTIKTGLQIIYNYKIKFNDENFNEVHEESAFALYDLCIQNDGLYVKFGQGVAASEHILPPSYSKWFCKLQDKAKSVEYDKVENIIMEDLGKKPNEIFKFFDPEPIASASIAQVHKAILKNGQEVAVKIQKPHIAKQFNSDMRMHYLFLVMMEKVFNLPLICFHDNINYNLKKEVDFRIEYLNSQKCDINFKKLGRTDIYVPQVYDQYTTKRILVMEWIDGIKITDEQKLRDSGFDIKKALNTTIEAFAEQIFITGFAHADPHPGNIFLRRNPCNTSEQQVVLLDYGLCYQIDDQIRQEYCQLWKSLFLQDFDTLSKIGKKWGVQDNEAFASLQLFRPYQKDKPINFTISKKDVYKLQFKFKNDFRQMLGDTNKLPKDLLYINRNMNLVRSINKRMGSKVNRINVMVKSALKGIDIQEYGLIQYFNLLWFEIRLMFSSIFYNLNQIWLHFTLNKGFEDVLDEAINEVFQEKYKTYGMITYDQNTFNA